jgi:COP9 signalosome complex subunit 6
MHPLVVMSIADHMTRKKVQNNESLAIGLLVGASNGAVFSVQETIEIAFTLDGDLQLDIEILKADFKLYRQNYPDCEVMGWYVTQNGLEDYLINAHMQIQRMNERAILAVLNPDVSVDAKDVPLTVYELTDSNAHCKTAFQDVGFKMEEDEAEQAVLQYCANVIGDVASVEQKSQVSAPTLAVVKAVDSLNARVEKLILFLEDVKAGRQVADQQLLRQIRGLCNRLPADHTNEFRGEYMTEMNDVMLMTYLATITKSTATSKAVVKAFNTAQAGQRESRDNDVGSGLGNMLGGLMNFF